MSGMQVATDAPVGSLVGIAQFAHDTWGPPLAVGRMAIDSDKVDQSITQGKAVIVLQPIRL